MHLVIDTYGTKVSLSEGLLRITRVGQEAAKIPFRDVTGLQVGPGVLLSSDVLMAALDKGVRVLFTDGQGHPQGHLFHGKFGPLSTVRRKQLRFAESPMGMQWVREAVLRKMEAQIHWLYQLAYSDPELQGSVLPQARTAEEAARQVREARIFEEGIQLSSLQASFRGWEGSASRAYFQGIALALPEPYRFQKRGRRPAQDRFNCVLNYLYGILYGQVEMVLVQAGLDPHVGIMHADGHNRPSLAFDFIEPYRPWADAVAFRLCLAHALPAEAFDRKDGGLWLNAKGKPVVVEAFFQFLDEVILWKQVWRGRRHHLLLDAQRLAQQVLLMPDA